MYLFIDLIFFFTLTLTIVFLMLGVLLVEDVKLLH